jgi:hypothetical protein
MIYYKKKMGRGKSVLPVFVFLFLFSLTFISAAPAPFEAAVTEGYLIEPTIKDYIQQGQPHNFGIHVFNKSNGLPIIDGLSCYMELYHARGTHIYAGEVAAPTDIFDYNFDLTSGNFTSLGQYQAKFQCNDSIFGGATEIQFEVISGTQEGLDTFWVIVIALIIAVALIMYGFAQQEHPPITLGSMMMLGLALYIWLNGFGTLGTGEIVTQLIAFALFLIGATLSFKSLSELK